MLCSIPQIFGFFLNKANRNGMHYANAAATPRQHARNASRGESIYIMMRQPCRDLSDPDPSRDTYVCGCLWVSEMFCSSIVGEYNNHTTCHTDSGHALFFTCNCKSNEPGLDKRIVLGYGTSPSSWFICALVLAYFSWNNIAAKFPPKVSVLFSQIERESERTGTTVAVKFTSQR